jgi:fructuronate reductase
MPASSRRGAIVVKRLNHRAAHAVRNTVRRWRYSQPALRPGIVHLGVGAFHRAHQAVSTDLVLEQAFGPWGICGVSLRRPEVRDRLAPQSGLYTVAECDGAGERLQIIGCLRRLLVAPEDPAAVVAQIASPATTIVSLTVTEKGYCHDPASGRLDWAHPDIVHDLANAERPRSAVGMLVARLGRRRSRQIAPPTVMSCDNLPANGRTLQRLVIALAARRDEALARWIEAEVAFPCSMVDRIVPATTAADIARIGQALTVHDAAPVVCEPFRQWVIEDRFAGPRPAWELAGVQLVADVAPYEEMKLRLLNGSHSAIAYLGCLAGFEHVFEVMAAPDFVAFVRRMMAEVAPTLRVPGDLTAYQATLIARFANPALAHRTRQIAMDGSQKLPQRLLGPIRDRLRVGAAIDHLCLAVPGWIRYASGQDEQGRAIEVADPLASRFAAISAEAGSDSEALARGFLELGEVFGADLPREERFTAALTGWLASLLRRGARATVAHCVRA